MQRERIAIIEGVRTPIGKASGSLKKQSATDLGTLVVKEIIERSEIDIKEVDEIIFGNVAQPVQSANIARVISLRAGLSKSVPAYTVHRNCASGMESITTAMNKILSGYGEIFIAGGTESMSNIPLLYNKTMTSLFTKLSNKKLTLFQRIKLILSFRIGHLKPIIGLVEGLTDPVCGLNMGQTAEVLAKEFKISREEQDQYTLESHHKASNAIKNNIFKDEIVPISIDSEHTTIMTQDECPRANQTLEALAKLKPYFDRHNGTVTVGNACPVNDGAAAIVVMSESKAKSMQLKPLGYLKDYSYAALEPHRMGLGPIYATADLFKKTKLTIKDIDLIEMNEAFAAQVIANQHAFASDSFAQKYLNQSKAVGEIDPNIININGGAIAIGHPVGMTGTRLVIHVLKQLKKKNLQTGLATLCVGGGQGASLLLEKE